MHLSLRVLTYFPPLVSFVEHFQDWLRINAQWGGVPVDKDRNAVGKPRGNISNVSSPGVLVGTVHGKFDRVTWVSEQPASD